MNLPNEERGQSRRPAAAGAAETLAGALPVSGDDWAAWLLDAARPPVAPDTSLDLGTALTWLARRQGYLVRRAARASAGSETNWASRRVQVPDHLEERQAARALLHELGHILADGHGFHPPGASTAGCRGVQKLVADSVAFIAATRMGMDGSSYTWPHVASWAGSDPRARPEDIIYTVTERITKAAARIITHLDITVLGIPPQPASTARPQPRRPPASPVPQNIGRALKDAEHFYQAQLRRSWTLSYLASRGFNQTTLAEWHVGYAPPGWTVLLTHLRGLGHDDASIQAAGLGRMSSRGTLIDHFRDRAMVAIRDERGRIVGFIGRARPDADPRTPKYLNSPDSAVFKKGNVLFGLHQARHQLGQGAVPVLVEGPFDAMAVSVGGEGRHAGLALCGTAFTQHQAEALARAAHLRHTGILVALDADRAGQKGAIKAYEILRPHTGKANAVMLPPGRDPAEILQQDGPAALCAALEHIEPLARVVIDAHIDQWADRLDHAEGQLGAMRSAAAHMARLLRPETVDAILYITGEEPLSQFDGNQRLSYAELQAIARILPAETLCQIARTADRTSSEYSEVTAALADTVAENPGIPKGVGDAGRGCHAAARVAPSPVRVAAAGFVGRQVLIAKPSPAGGRARSRPQRSAVRPMI